MPGYVKAGPLTKSLAAGDICLTWKFEEYVV